MAAPEKPQQGDIPRIIWYLDEWGTLPFSNTVFSHLETRRSGHGCRKTQAWDCIVSQEELLKKREEFWDTRVEGNSDYWKLLRMACEAPDPASAEAIVLAGGLTMPHGTLMTCYDSMGEKYDLPPFIINDPVKFRRSQGGVEEDPNIPNETYHLVLRSSKAPDVSVIMSSIQSAIHLKEVFSAKTNIPIDNIRLFFNGKELKNDLPLGKAKLMDEVVVQVMVV